MKTSVILNAMFAAVMVGTLTSCSLLSSGNNQPVGGGQPSITSTAPVEQNVPASGGGRETGGVANADGDSSGTGDASGSSSTPTEQAVATAASCANGVNIPAGVDAGIVCAASVSSTVRLPGFKAPGVDGGATTYYGFKSPTGNLSCDWSDGPTVECTARVMGVAYPHDPRNDDCPTDVMECAPRGLYVADDGTGVGMPNDVRVMDQIPDLPNGPVLGYGQIALSTDYPMSYVSDIRPQDPVACYSAQDGVTCWNTVTHHGIKISRTQAVYW